LVTGITGFAGSHLAEYLLSREDVEVYGICRWRSKLDNLEDLARQGQLNSNPVEVNITSPQMFADHMQPGKVNLLQGDIADPSSLHRVVELVRPDRIFHLAAQSYVPTSWNAPAETFHVNAIGQINLFEAILQVGMEPLIHIAGSSEEYGLVLPHEAPIKETNPLRPLSPYAVSKVAQDLLAYQYHQSYGLKAIVTRGFNHTGPRHGEVLSCSSFAKRIAQIEEGLKEPVLWVGNLEARRDFTDVRDIVRGYWLALEKCTPGECYNVGSAVARTIDSVLELLLSMSKVQIEVRQDPARMRPSDVMLLWADCSKFHQATNWKPEIPFETTMADLLQYWRRRIAKSKERGDCG
jgi:GDP-4-dehydro-6-deoxy-D-mannose reductase